MANVMKPAGGASAIHPNGAKRHPCSSVFQGAASKRQRPVIRLPSIIATQ